MATNTKQYGPKGVRHQRIPTMDPIARALPFFGSMPVEDILVLWQFETNTPVGVVVSTAVDVRLWCRVVGAVVGNCVEAKKRCKVAGKETCNVQQTSKTCRRAGVQTCKGPKNCKLKTETVVQVVCKECGGSCKKRGRWETWC